MYPVFAWAVDTRIYQIARLLGLTAPIGELSSDTLITAYNPQTQDSWTVNDIKNDPEWNARGNADENGETSGYDFQKLRDAEPLSETNFILTDVPANKYELVWKWLRSRLPNNAGDDEGVTWRFRDGVTLVINDIGTLPDSNPVDGNYANMNSENWLRFDIRKRRFVAFEDWRNVYLVTDTEADPAEVCYIDDQYEENEKVGRSGEVTPFYQFPVGSPVIALVDPVHVEAGGIQWTRLQR